ncbi:MAG: PAS domain S-box protein [Synechocystis sp.]|nr:PAS domain S-box protein [Synechocystis sp.]
MSFVSRYIEEIPAAVDWEPLCLSADLTVAEAIAVWRNYFRGRSQENFNTIAPISCAVVIRGNTLVGLLPDWQLARTWGTDQVSDTVSLANICVAVDNPVDINQLPSFSALITAFSHLSPAVLPIWSEERQGWGLLSVGNLVRHIDLDFVWQKLSLQTVALPDCLLSADATVQDLIQQCFDHQLSAIPLLIRPDLAGESSGATLRCLSLNEYLMRDNGDRQSPIVADLPPPPRTCRLNHSYGHARQVLKQQSLDYVLTTQINGDLYGWVTPQQWVDSLQPEALLIALQMGQTTPLLIHTLENRIVRQQQQLQQDQHLIQRFLAQNPNLIYLYDLRQQQICYLNYSLSAMIGYSCLQKSTQPDHFIQFQQPLLPDRYFAPDQLRQLASDEKQEFYFEVVDPDRNKHYFAVEVSVFEQDPNGQTTQLLCIAKDVSNNHRTEIALQTRETQLQTLVNTIADGILIVDQGGTVIYANPVACQMFGSNLEELLQSHLGLAITPDQPMEISIMLPDQTPGVGELKATSIQWQGANCSLIAIRDVTDRQRVLEQWQASEEKYRNLLETLPNLVWRLGSTGELEDCNQRTLDYLGQKKTTLLGTGWQRSIHPDQLSLTLTQWQQGLAMGRFFQLEYRLRRADGVYHWHLLQMLPLQDGPRQGGYWLASNTDIDSLKQAESLIRQQARQEQLLTAIGQRIRQSLNLDQILRNAVEEVRRTLQVDRVLVYQVYENGTGAAIAESVAKEYPSVLSMTFAEEVFPPECYERYINGYVYALTDRETGFVLDCLVDFLAAIEVRAKVVVPIVFGEKLWGLLITHQCSGPRVWKKVEVQLLQSLGNQLAIAIQQSLLYQRLSEELVERTRAEQQLLDLTRLQQGILDGANYIIISTDINGIILAFNRTAEELLGYRADEVIGQQTPLIFHDQTEIQTRASTLSETLKQTIDPNSFEIFTFSALSQGVYESEWTYITKNGDRFPVNLSVTALQDDNNNPIGFVGLASDLRQQKQIETQRQTLDFVVRNSTELIVITDLDQKVIFLNQAGQTLVGLENETAASQTYLTEFLTQDCLSLWQAEIIPQVLRSRAWEGEFSLQHFQTRQEIAVTGSIFLLNDPETQKAKNLVGIMHDITHIKNAEKRTLEALEFEKQLSELRSRFITMASHEFRTPLSIIASSTAILETYYQRLSDEKRQEHLQRVQSSVKHMTSLLDDVLTINRAETNRLNFQPQPQDLIAFCQTLRDDLQIGDGNHQILFLPQDLPPSLEVYFDAKLLQQIFTNLLSNAIKYSPFQSNIEFYLRRENALAVFIVQDHGIGIPPEDLPKIFDSFHRANNVGTIQGTGLGLAIAKKCTELHGGSIEVTSALGQGTCVTVRLPLWANQAQTTG